MYKTVWIVLYINVTKLDYIEMLRIDIQRVLTEALKGKTKILK